MPSTATATTNQVAVDGAAADVPSDVTADATMNVAETSELLPLQTPAPLPPTETTETIPITADESIASASSAVPSELAPIALFSGAAANNMRGYVAYFRWSTHYDQPSNSRCAVTQTDIVGSIPSIFHRIIALLTDVEWSVRRRNIMETIHKTLARVAHDNDAVRPRRSTDVNTDEPFGLNGHLLPLGVDSSSRPLMNDPYGTRYVITACRKEHVRIIYEADGLLPKLQLCPCLIDIYTMERNGKLTLIGGYGPDVAKGEGHCTCNTIKPEFTPTEHSNDILSSDAVESHDQTNGVTVSNGQEMDETDALSVDKLFLPPIAHLDGTDGTDDAMNGGGAPSLHVNIDGGGGGSGSGSANSNVLSDNERERWRKRIAALSRSNNDLLERNRALAHMCATWESSWRDERDLNVRLWDRIQVVQTQIRRLSRPLTSALASQGRL